MAAVHPFPARMAPELAEAQLSGLASGRVLLDPMMGSGTFVLSAALRGHHAIGVDTDPLARVITLAAAGQYDKAAVVAEATRITRTAAKRAGSVESAADPSTREFIDFWFDPTARDRLAAIAEGIDTAPQELQAALWCAFSRLIITKDNGASRGRDVSHSRPHRVRDVTSFNPLEQFPRAVATVTNRAHDGQLPGTLTVLRGDARTLRVPDNSVHGIMTSPPYLIAIDYMRGHRLSLVWMGHTLAELREVRSTNIGSERGADLPAELAAAVAQAVDGDLGGRATTRVLNRYVRDVDALLAEQARVLHPDGRLTFVVANAKHGSSSVSVERLVRWCAKAHGLKYVSRRERVLPSNRRYLPPPKSADGGALDQRMHIEVIINFKKPAA